MLPLFLLHLKGEEKTIVSAYEFFVKGKTENFQQLCRLLLLLSIYVFYSFLVSLILSFVMEPYLRK